MPIADAFRFTCPLTHVEVVTAVRQLPINWVMLGATIDGAQPYSPQAVVIIARRLAGNPAETPASVILTPPTADELAAVGL